MSKRPNELQEWRDRLLAFPTVIEGMAEVIDDGYEQQGLYIGGIPLSESLLFTLSPETREQFFATYPIGRVRITVTFEALPEE